MRSLFCNCLFSSLKLKYFSQNYPKNFSSSIISTFENGYLFLSKGNNWISLYHLLHDLRDVGWKEEKAASWVARRCLRSVRIGSLNPHLLDHAKGDKGIWVWNETRKNSKTNGWKMKFKKLSFLEIFHNDKI
jgi:hypothetical protein